MEDRQTEAECWSVSVVLERPRRHSEPKRKAGGRTDGLFVVVVVVQRSNSRRWVRVNKEVKAEEEEEEHTKMHMYTL